MGCSFLCFAQRLGLVTGLYVTSGSQIGLKQRHCLIVLHSGLPRSIVPVIVSAAGPEAVMSAAECDMVLCRVAAAVCGTLCNRLDGDIPPRCGVVVAVASMLQSISSQRGKTQYVWAGAMMSGLLVQVVLSKLYAAMAALPSPYRSGLTQC